MLWEPLQPYREAWESYGGGVEIRSHAEAHGSQSPACVKCNGATCFSGIIEQEGLFWEWNVMTALGAETWEVYL